MDDGRDPPAGAGGTLLVAGVLAALLAAAVLFAWYVWRELGEVELGLHGWLALALGVVATAGLGVGLMMLVYHSHRRGYDERAGRDD
jgi:hypothetical protein